MRQTYFGHMGIIGMVFLWAITSYAQGLINSQIGSGTFVWFLFIFGIIMFVASEFISSTDRWFK